MSLFQHSYQVTTIMISNLLRSNGMQVSFKSAVWDKTSDKHLPAHKAFLDISTPFGNEKYVNTIVNL